jgi:hypothetical protein
LRSIAEVVASAGSPQCRFEDGTTAEAPGILARFLQRRDQLRFLGARTEILIQHPTGRRRQQLLHATIGYVGLPNPGKNGEAFVRAELPDCKEGPRALFLSEGALRRYFYLLDGDEPQSLYRLLRVPDTATLDQLRFAWRMRSLELQVSDSKARDLPYVERAFNVLAHADLRNCYDALCKNENAAPLFPYGGLGSILADGHLSDDEDAFFADRILAYKPEMTSRKVTLLLRRCEFFADRVVCRDPRRKLEVWLDSRMSSQGWAGISRGTIGSIRYGLVSRSRRPSFTPASIVCTTANGFSENGRPRFHPGFRLTRLRTLQRTFSTRR